MRLPDELHCEEFEGLALAHDDKMSEVHSKKCTQDFETIMDRESNVVARFVWLRSRIEKK